MDFGSTRWASGRSDSGGLIGSSTRWTPLILAMGCYGGGSLILGWVDVVVGWLILNFRFLLDNG